MAALYSNNLITWRFGSRCCYLDYPALEVQGFFDKIFSKILLK